MGILIKGMDLPVEGLRTVNIHSDGLVYVHGSFPTELHEAVPIQASHGRLVDANELVERACKMRLDTREKIVNMIETAPTIIRLEEGTHYRDLCDNCVGKDICGVAKSCDHNPPITSCYGYKKEGTEE